MLDLLSSPEAYKENRFFISCWVDYLMFSSYLISQGYTTKHKRFFELEQLKDPKEFELFKSYYFNIIKNYDLKIPPIDLTLDQLIQGGLLTTLYDSEIQLLRSSSDFRFTIKHNIKTRISEPLIYCSFSALVSSSFTLPNDRAEAQSKVLNRTLIAHTDTPFSGASDTFLFAYNQLSTKIKLPTLPQMPSGRFLNRASLSERLIPNKGVFPTWLYFALIQIHCDLIKGVLAGEGLMSPQLIFNALLPYSKFWNVNNLTEYPV